jgi:thioredoxin-like negative regulator of GroEL
MRRALALREKSYGPDHPNVEQALNNLAMLLLATKRRDEAKPLLRRALPVLETSLGVDHPYTVGARRNLAAIEAVHEKGT